MSHFDHDQAYIGQHKPTIRTHEDGVKVTCPCGWSVEAGTRPRAARESIAHLRAVKASEGGAR